MNRKSWLVVLAALAVTAAVAMAAALIPQTRRMAGDAPALSVSESPAQETQADVPSSTPGDTASTEVGAYLVVTVQGMMYEPLPLAGEGSFTIKQDENTTNTIHVTPESIWMEHSTCDNQDCVDQGAVSLANMNTRVLSNMIICLPNQVTLELYTPETLASTFGVTP